MAEQKGPRIQCMMKDFGPIREGRFDLAPLTVFIGPNGSGKTYAATLAYLFGESLWRMLTTGTVITVHNEKSPEGIIIQANISQEPGQVTDFVKESLLRYFGRKSETALIRRRSDSLEIGVRIEEIPLQIQGIYRRKGGWLWSLSGFDQLHQRLARLVIPQSKPPEGLTIAKVFRAFQEVIGFPPETYYLPAARAGLLQGWRALTAKSVQIVGREIDLRHIEATPYTGVTGKFLSTLAEGKPPYWAWQEEPAIGTGQSAVNYLLEKEILNGYIDWLSPEDPELMLFQKGMRIPLTAISSGLAELAALDFYLRKGILRPGSWLIIEEPEAHLHPENQRRVATLMVRLVRWGVRVLCTTHSDIILHQISNHLLLEEALKRGHQPPEGLDPEWDRLGYDEVGVYLFRLEDDGSVIERVEPEPGFGIPEDEFVRVAEAIGDETYSLIDLIEPD